MVSNIYFFNSRPLLRLETLINNIKLVIFLKKEVYKDDYVFNIIYCHCIKQCLMGMLGIAIGKQSFTFCD